MLVGCTTIEPPTTPTVTEEKKTVFSHDSFNLVLQRFVNESGQVDYSALKKDPHDLDLYYQLVAAYSPDSHPDMFPTNNHKLAYWINAYNAAVIKTVITYYPVDSVLKVKPPALFFFLPNKSGFFIFQKPIIGRRKMSLYHFENSIIRKRFPDPRVHFALNCASLGCPRMPRQVFTGKNLDEQLDMETRKFVAEERNFKIDYENKMIFLSEIFKWYENDFLSWYRQNYPKKTAGLLNYIALYLAPEKVEELKKVEKNYTLQFIPYDWSLNDQVGKVTSIKTILYQLIGAISVAVKPGEENW
jgi:hypothetical protein